LAKKATVQRALSRRPIDPMQTCGWITAKHAKAWARTESEACSVLNVSVALHVIRRFLYFASLVRAFSTSISRPTIDSAEQLTRTHSALGGVPYSKTWYTASELSVPDAKKPFGTFEFICHELPAGKTTRPGALFFCVPPLIIRQ